MNGTEIVALLINNIPSISTLVSAVTGALLTTIFLRNNTSVQAFEKVKAERFDEVVDDLLKVGEMTYLDFYKAKNFLKIAKLADNYYSRMPKREEAIDEYDFDWFFQFYEVAGNIGNKEMQDIWAKILAGELSKPSSFSLRTIDTLKNISKYDAMLFEKICSSSFIENNICFLPSNEEYLTYVGINYLDILRLNEMGLLSSNGFIHSNVKINGEFRILLRNLNAVVCYNADKSDNKTIKIEQYPFTQVGNELARLRNIYSDNDKLLKFATILKNKEKDNKIEVYLIKSISEEHITIDKQNILEKYQQSENDE